jgi:hypothetical protein
MSSPWLQVVGALGVAIIGGLVAPQVTLARERRSARADLLAKVRVVEEFRWSDETYVSFIRALTSLEAAAVMAGIPRRVLREYTTAVKTARTTRARVDYGEYEDWTNDPQVENAVDEALEGISRAIWHPWRSRMTIRRRHQRVNRSTAD